MSAGIPSPQNCPARVNVSIRWFCVFFRKLKEPDIFQVDGPAGGPLRCDEVFFGQNEEVLSLVVDRLTMLPGAVEINPRSGCLHIETHTISKDGYLVRQQILYAGQRGCAETGIQQSVEETVRVFRCGLNQNFEVECGTRYTVQDGGNPPDDDVSNVMLLK